MCKHMSAKYIHATASQYSLLHYGLSMRILQTMIYTFKESSPISTPPLIYSTTELGVT